LQRDAVVQVPGGQSAPVGEGAGELVGKGFGVKEVVDGRHAFVADDRIEVADLHREGLVPDFSIGLRHRQPVVLTLGVPTLCAVLAPLDPVALCQEIIVPIHEIQAPADAPIAARGGQRFLDNHVQLVEDRNVAVDGVVGAAEVAARVARIIRIPAVHPAAHAEESVLGEKPAHTLLIGLPQGVRPQWIRRGATFQSWRLCREDRRGRVTERDAGEQRLPEGTPGPDSPTP
jgi:hypothetical protein